jgi:hypothetical protein
MRQRVIHLLRSLDAISVENPVYPGTPDVNFVEGWLELKWLPDWPARKETVVHIDHFTPQQRVWLLKRSTHRGNARLLLCVHREWLLFDGLTASAHVGRVPRNLLYKLAQRCWAKPPSSEELIPCLR